MTSTDHGIAAARPPRLPLTLGDVAAGAKRALGRHPILVAAVVVALWGGGVAGGVVALNSSGGFQAAAACPAADSYVYAVPSYPLQRAPAPAWPPPQDNYWGWMVRRHALKVGDRVRVDTGGLWQVTAIAALPIDCHFMTVSPPVTIGRGPAPLAGGSVAGRLVLQPVG